MQKKKRQCLDIFRSTTRSSFLAPGAHFMVPVSCLALGFLLRPQTGATPSLGTDDILVVLLILFLARARLADHLQTMLLCPSLAKLFLPQEPFLLFCLAHSCLPLPPCLTYAWPPRFVANNFPSGVENRGYPREVFAL